MLQAVSTGDWMHRRWEWCAWFVCVSKDNLLGCGTYVWTGEAGGGFEREREFESLQWHNFKVDYRGCPILGQDDFTLHREQDLDI